ncbi:MAG: T9SS type A sorting domain-containing protein [candidate division Zixibacteria bacterium]|nr:T9SS type A sorting domain-containing protein [Candidatus Tariuqbacter arcticus]
MKTSSTILLVVILTATSIAQPQPPDTLWTKTFGGSSSDYGWCVQQTSDGGYIVAGETYSFVPDPYQNIYLIKTDADGDTIWTRIIGGDWGDVGRSVQQTTDGGYIVAGTSENFGGNWDFYLVKTDANGDTLWTRPYGGGAPDVCYSGQQTQDGGYILAGYTRSFGGFDRDVYLVKTDADGDTLWTRTYDGPADDYGMSIQQTTDEGYIIGGYTYSYGAGEKDVYLIKTNINGDTVWTCTYGGNQYDSGWSVQQTTDGGYIIAGCTNSYGAGMTDVYLIKTDADGDTIWTRTYGGSDCDGGYSVQQTYDGGYIIAGMTWPLSSPWRDVYVVRTDVNGDTIWTRTVCESYFWWESGTSVQQTLDGGYIISGNAENMIGYHHLDVYLVRLESDFAPLSVTLTPYNTPIQIPPGGGSFVFDALVENNTVNPINFDAWEEVILPNGTIYDPFIMRSGLVSPAGSSIIRQITQFVPANVRAGSFTYIGNVGLYPVTVVASDSFPFEVLPGESAPNHNLGWAAYGWEGTEEPVFSTPPNEYISLSTHPNPFNTETLITFDLPYASTVEIAIYNIAGRKVASLAGGKYEAGTHQVPFDGSELSSGIYFVRLQAGEQIQTQKCLLIR